MRSFDDAPDGTIDNAQKELCAIVAMRAMLEDYADARGIPFEDGLLAFARTNLHDALFDLPTRLWAESPAYLMALFEEEQPQRSASLTAISSLTAVRSDAYHALREIRPAP